jgi:predicted ATPase
LLKSSPSQGADVQLIAELMSIPTSDRFSPLPLTARQKREKTIEVLLNQLEILARQQPLLIVYEDAHWIDPSSRELLDRVVDHAAGLPILLIVSSRPEFQPLWKDRAHVTSITLPRLGPYEGAALVERVAGDCAIPKDIVAEIVERTDGVPLFVEELTKSIVEIGMRKEDIRTAMATVLPSNRCTRYTLCTFNVAPRSSWRSGQRSSTDWCGYRTRVLVRIVDTSGTMQ